MVSDIAIPSHFHAVIPIYSHSMPIPGLPHSCYSYRAILISVLQGGVICCRLT